VGQIDYRLSLFYWKLYSLIPWIRPSLGFNIGYLFELLKISGGYDVVFASDSFQIGPVFSSSGSLPLGSVSVYNNSFALDFATQTVGFAA
jgi:hypothetical protein